MFQKYKVIQGGMGVGVSGWKLAKAVSTSGGVGTLSGTAVSQLLIDTLQRGDLDGNFRRALSHFPFPKIMQMVMDYYFVEGGIEKSKKSRTGPMFSLDSSKLFIAVTICANFAFVWLAKEGHSNPVLINYLEKIQVPHIYSICGAMLASVDGVVMGAGIPKEIPRIIDEILENKEVSYPINVIGMPGNSIPVKWNPTEFFDSLLPKLQRPVFFPIVSSHVLAMRLLKSNPTKIGGFIVEAPTAGGHNAPPRGKLELNELGEPIYGSRDEVSWEEMKKLGVPYWIAGSVASSNGLTQAIQFGAAGIQAGSIFAFSNESGILENLKGEIRRLGYLGSVRVFTSPVASPTGFPFKILPLVSTLSEKEVYETRKRNCSLGYLREAVFQNGKIVFRCSAEPEKDYVRKGGKLEDTVGRVCLCNALCATVGARVGELPVVTSGDDLSFLKKLMKSEWDSYSAEQAVRYILKNVS